MLDASVNGPGTSLVNLVYYFSVDALGKDNPAHVPISGNIHYLINGESIATGAGWGTTAQINAVSLNGSNSQYDSNFATVNCFKAPGSLQVCPNGSGQNRSVHLSLAVLSQEVNRISLVANAISPTAALWTRLSIRSFRSIPLSTRRVLASS